MNGHSWLSQGGNPAGYWHDLVTSSLLCSELKLWSILLYFTRLFISSWCVCTCSWYMHVCTYVCIGMLAFVCPCEGQRSTLSIFLYCASPLFIYFFLSQGCYWMKLMFQLGYWTATPWDLPVSVPSFLQGWGDFYMELGSQLRTSCLCRKQLPHWAISPALTSLLLRLSTVYSKCSHFFQNLNSSILNFMLYYIL